MGLRNGLSLMDRPGENAPKIVRACTISGALIGRGVRPFS